MCVLNDFNTFNSTEAANLNIMEPKYPTYSKNLGIMFGNYPAEQWRNYFDGQIGWKVKKRIIYVDLGTHLFFHAD